MCGIRCSAKMALRVCSARKRVPRTTSLTTWNAPLPNSLTLFQKNSALIIATIRVLARRAKKLRKRVFAIVGRIDENRPLREVFDKVYELAEPGMSEKENIKRAAELLRERAQELA